MFVDLIPAIHDYFRGTVLVQRSARGPRSTVVGRVLFILNSPCRVCLVFFPGCNHFRRTTTDVRRFDCTAGGISSLPGHQQSERRPTNTAFLEWECVQRPGLPRLPRGRCTASGCMVYICCCSLHTRYITAVVVVVLLSTQPQNSRVSPRNVQRHEHAGGLSLQLF